MQLPATEHAIMLSSDMWHTSHSSEVQVNCLRILLAAQGDQARSAYVKESPTKSMRRPVRMPGEGGGCRKWPEGSMEMLSNHAAPMRASDSLVMVRLWGPAESQSSNSIGSVVHTRLGRGARLCTSSAAGRRAEARVGLQVPTPCTSLVLV